MAFMNSDGELISMSFSLKSAIFIFGSFADKGGRIYVWGTVVRRRVWNSLGQDSKSARNTTSLLLGGEEGSRGTCSLISAATLFRTIPAAWHARKRGKK